jgi:hypothetical protein
LRQDNLTTIEKNNLKILATLMCYIVRHVADNTDNIMDFPWEWKASMFSDEKMSKIYKIPAVSKAITRHRVSPEINCLF